MPIIGPPPALTTAQRNALTQANRQKGTVIFNTDFGRLEVNSGTDIAPAWQILSGESHGTALPTTGLYNGYRFTYFTGNVAWELIYRGDLDGTYPWHSVGGQPLQGGSSVTTPRLGFYRIELGARGQGHGAADNILMTITAGGVTLNAYSGGGGGGTQGNYFSLYDSRITTSALTTGQVLTWTNSGTNAPTDPYIRISPLRIG